MPALHTDTLAVLTNASISTWFRVGGCADRLYLPTTIDALREAVLRAPTARVLGAGANLLVSDEGVADAIDLGKLRDAPMEHDPSRELHAWAGESLQIVLTRACRAGMGGLESLAGVPATIGGALAMNAGGRYGEIGEFVARVRVLDRGVIRVIPRESIKFQYRDSPLRQFIIIDAVFSLVRAEPTVLLARRDEIVRAKSQTQPLSAWSAGCVFRNPTLTRAIEGVGGVGQRVSAGMLIDMTGCKGLSVRGATVSDRHANFIVASENATSAAVIELIEEIERRVNERFGVQLEREIVIWRRD